MPRAFLITHRRYNTPVEYERRESSPERRVSVAEVDDDRCVGQLPSPSEGPTDTTDASDASSECPEELYNLTQLADVSLAAAAGHLFGHRSLAIAPHIRKYPFLNNLYHYERFHKNYTIDHEETRTEYKEEDLSMREKYFRVHNAEPHGCELFEDHDGELKEGAIPSGEVHGCPDCGKRYSTSSNLARHRQTHRSLGDKKARRCPHCDKVYVSMPAFSMHVRTHNQGCKCTHCGKCFSRPWLLQGHIRTHTGEKPFKCSICTKAFADKSNLRAHVQTHSNTKPHICSRCGKAFALKSYLYKHEESSCMRVHGDTSPITVGVGVGVGVGVAVPVITSVIQSRAIAV